MPKLVDHDARRREIAEAVLRLAAGEGLESVSLRHVAAEAGVSMGAVQHYFRTKDAMLLFALEHQATRREHRIAERLSGGGTPPTPRAVIRTCLVEILPTDERSRAEWLVGIAYFIRALHDPSMAAVISEAAPELIKLFADQLAVARDAGQLADGVDLRRESTVLWALLDSQATAIVLGHLTPEEAVATVDYHLNRLFVRTGGG